MERRSFLKGLAVLAIAPFVPKIAYNVIGDQDDWRAKRLSYVIKADADGYTHPGTIAIHQGKPPPGWQRCHGQVMMRREYPELFNAIGTVYGGTKHAFRLPDMRARRLSRV